MQKLFSILIIFIATKSLIESVSFCLYPKVGFCDNSLCANPPNKIVRSLFSTNEVNTYSYRNERQSEISFNSVYVLAHSYKLRKLLETQHNFFCLNDWEFHAIINVTIKTSTVCILPWNIKRKKRNEIGTRSPSQSAVPPPRPALLREYGLWICPPQLQDQIYTRQQT